MSQKQHVLEQENQKMQAISHFLQREIEDFQKQKAEVDASVNAMVKQYNSENVELHNQIAVQLDIQSFVNQTLERYARATQTPFFARIDFFEDAAPGKEAMYIGKNGVFDQKRNESIVVDWRAPAANLYYDGELGRTSYATPEGDIWGELSLKRTFTVEDGAIVDFYDSDLVTNDTLLQEYLAKNSDVVLKDIVATIQKDQNEIIRIDPWRHVVVQGVAGSGKTTVAVHRISYILYNFSKRYQPQSFVIIGSNRMFLNYIAGMLPELGVENIVQMTMPQFLLHVLDYEESCLVPLEGSWKGSLDYTAALRKFLDGFERRLFTTEDIHFYGYPVLTAQEALECTILSPAKTIRDKAEKIRDRIDYRVKNILPELMKLDEIESLGFPIDMEKNIFRQREKIRATIKTQARNLKKKFDAPLRTLTEEKLYQAFVKEQLEHCTQEDSLRYKQLLARLKKRRYDLSDLCALLYVRSRLCAFEPASQYLQFSIDEAQDFSPMVFDCLYRAFPQSYFTVMGDIAQNISKDGGLSSWETLTRQVYPQDKQYFTVLSKSYRNTIEIAEYANHVLERSNAKAYPITPVVRHGSPVRLQAFLNETQMLQNVKASLGEFKEQRYRTTAILCRDIAGADWLYTMLKDEFPINRAQVAQEDYQGGITIFPVEDVKGMEFDCVILFGAGEEDYSSQDIREARLLYVALTRALHELHILCKGAPSSLLPQGCD